MLTLLSTTAKGSHQDALRNHNQQPRYPTNTTTQETFSHPTTTEIFSPPISFSRNQPSHYSRSSHDSELVSIRQPSCVGLPPVWNAVHDRFIAYLATHAPLDRFGRVPRGEEGRERWRVANIVELLGGRFVELRGLVSCRFWKILG